MFTFIFIRLQNIPDTREEYKEKYHYTFSPCSPFDCRRSGIDNGLVRDCLEKVVIDHEILTLMFALKYGRVNNPLSQFSFPSKLNA